MSWDRAKGGCGVKQTRRTIRPLKQEYGIWYNRQYCCLIQPKRQWFVAEAVGIKLATATLLMLSCNPLFLSFLSPFDPHGLERHEGTIIGLWSDCTIAYLNPAWYEFSYRNGGEPCVSAKWGLGASMLTAVSRPLKLFYATAFLDCCRAMTPWEHTYECSSADVFRQFHMKVFPLSTNGEMLVIHSLAVERPHDRPSHPANENFYRDSRGYLTQCLHCRRFRHGSNSDRWDWVPDWLRRPPSNTADALCAICLDYYYPAK